MKRTLNRRFDNQARLQELVSKPSAEYPQGAVSDNGIRPRVPDKMQKYTIVKFIEPFRDGYEFPMTNWPLHITLADDFELDYKNSKLDDHLNRLLDRQKTVDVVALHDGYLGKYAQTLVTLVDTNVDLTELHKELVAVLKRCGAIFYNPHYIIGGYKPHVTVQRRARLHQGDVIKIDELSIVDMKPNGNRDRRKVVKTIGFKKPTTGR